jgi:heat shock protein HtpX
MQHGIGLQSSIWNNNLKSIFLLISFPFVICAMVWAVTFALYLSQNNNGQVLWDKSLYDANIVVLQYWWIIFSAVGTWFILAWFSHQGIINKETKAIALERKENPTVYNILENLCISRGIPVPKLFIIDSPVLNAYASGINKRTYAITLTKGLIEHLEKDELEAVIAHELTHIINRDVRLLIVSIIFVGIISVLSEMMVRSVLNGSRSNSSRGNNGKGKVVAVIMVLIIAMIGYFLSILIRFTISRRREYMADAGAVQLTKNSDSLIRALQKISGKSHMENIDSDIQQMMFDNQKSFLGLFSSHPSIESRISVLKNY